MSLVVAKSVHQRHAALPLDSEGFLVDSRIWNPVIAQQIADHHGIGDLDDTQWLIVDFIRDRYFRLGALPPMRSVCRKLGVDKEAVKHSFGGCRQLWQIAGLPNPGEEALAYMG